MLIPGKRCLLFALGLALSGLVSAQIAGKNPSIFGQEVPAFLRDKPASRTYEVEGKSVTIPTFQLPGEAYQLTLLDREDQHVGVPNRTSAVHNLRGAAFHYNQTLPHLAFFCRFEINEDRGGVIPMKFRLGGHQPWQNDLLR
ncbi:hypothetical protein [Neolewinella antarctica]|uniref:Uncharacterized protein n=1 Tax=Neolewinella antarctica TaxID=442734 RepID=A0ABX0X8U8_9BACT|nr:hypothetical protein [Neolewinella antarctica]NJC25364.1 hypothetical protein [Neolewinella antarctica]